MCFPKEEERWQAKDRKTLVLLVVCVVFIATCKPCHRNLQFLNGQTCGYSSFFLLNLSLLPQSMMLLLGAIRKVMH